MQRSKMSSTTEMIAFKALVAAGEKFRQLIHMAGYADKDHPEDTRTAEMLHYLATVIADGTYPPAADESNRTDLLERIRWEIRHRCLGDYDDDDD